MRTWISAGWLMAWLAVLGAPCPQSAEARPRAAAESLSRELPLNEGGRLTLQNSRGNIQISSWKENRLELRAETTAESHDELELVPLEIDAREDEIRIVSVYPVYAPELKVRVDYRLRVPREIDLKLVETVNGDIRISGVSGRAILRVDNGEIEVKGFYGYLKATSINGRIEAEVSRLDEASHVSLENYNHDISLRIPRNLKACWMVRTLNGFIESTKPFEILDDFGPKTVHVDERQQPVISLYSVNGDIRIEER